MERVILIKGNSSNWYEQAIFIVKRNLPRGVVPVDFVKEAEKIIDQYMRTGKTIAPHDERRKSQSKATIAKRNSFDILLNKILLVGCLIIAAVMAWNWFL